MEKNHPNHQPGPDRSMKAYWKENVRFVLVLMGIWFVVSFLLSIVFVDTLNQFTLGGFKLGFWFAQQGSMLIYIVLILVYIVGMNKLDKKYDVDEI
jgi:putative solute:sodium symporter small subunit